MVRRGLPVLVLGGALAAAVIPACGDDEEPSNIATFAGPSAIAVAGPEKNRLFIANRHEDTLHVATLGETLDSFELLRAPAVHFALRIPAGPSPSALAATADGGYLVVLNGVGETLRLIDATDLVPVLSEGGPLAVPVGSPGSAPASLAAAPRGDGVPPELACVAPCLGRFYVALAGRGSIASFEVQGVDGGVPSIVALGEFAVGGAPTALAVQPASGRFVFASDAIATEVVRVDAVTGAIDRIDVGAVPGALVMSQDGGALVVARPRLRDVVVIGGIGDAPAIDDADPPYVPVPTCIEACGEPGTCAGQHAADAAICGTGDGLAASPTAPAYQAIYLGVVPSWMTAWQADPTFPQEGVAAVCGEARRSYSQFVAVGSLSGHISFVGLKRTSDADALTPELVTTSFCETATVEPLAAQGTVAAPPISDYLGPCPPVPQRKRFVCVSETVDVAGTPVKKEVVVAFPARSDGSQWSFDWEGVLIARELGGRIEPYTGAPGEASFVFADVAQDLGAALIEPGDILEIQTLPKTDDPDCADVVKPDETGSVPLCAREWRIERLDTSVTPARLVLAASADCSLVEACYPTPGTIAYDIRAGGKYLLRRNGLFQGRISPGQVIGPGGDLGWDFEALFQFNPEAGSSSRGNPFGFTIKERYVPVRAGNSDFGLISSMQTTTLPGGPTVLFVTYEASNTLFGLDPSVVADFNKDENYLVIR